MRLPMEWRLSPNPPPFAFRLGCGCKEPSVDIAEREEDFARDFTEHLLGYALGGPFGFTDQNLANEIFNTLVEGEAFRTSVICQQRRL